MVVLREHKNMFWGVILDGGKCYSQTVEHSFHISMAALEPTSSSEAIIQGDKHAQVSVMIQHEKAEFMLCTLDHKHTYQQPLDLNFTEGEEVTFFLNGNGVIHLTGYLIDDDKYDDADETNLLGDSSSEDEAVDSDEEVPTLQALTESDMQDSDEDEDEEEDWTPQTGKRKKRQLDTSNKKNKNAAKKQKVSLLEEEEEDSESETDDDEEDEEEEEEEDESGSEDSSSDAEAEDSDEDDDEEDDSDDSEDVLMNPDITVDHEREDSDADSTGSYEKVTNKSKQTESAKRNKEKQKQPVNLQNTPIDSNSAAKTASQSSKKKKQKNKDSQVAQGESSGQIRQNGDTPITKGEKTAKNTPKLEKKTLPGGTLVQDLKIGHGPEASQGKMVFVYYKGTLSNGKEFDAHLSGRPFKFRLGKGNVIKGWDTGVVGMKVGGKRKLVVPPGQGYGAHNMGPIPPNSTLVFEVELKSVK